MLAGLNRLMERKVEVNVLVLVNKANVDHASDVYRYITDLGIRYVQFIPCVETDRNGRLRPFAITGEEWGAFLTEIFELWGCRRHTPHLDPRL